MTGQSDINISEEVGKRLALLLDREQAGGKSSKLAAGFSGGILTLLTVVFLSGGHLATLERTAKTTEEHTARIRVIEAKMYAVDRACDDIKEIRAKIDAMWRGEK
ncbi:MAG: hypothetical protein EOM20_03355 [Spartobacteria bacterium]|nr:hypothetical protein [Spartobacteria bacterium]